VTRLTHQFRGGREQFQGVLSYNRTTVEAASLFSFIDTTQATNLNLDVNHSHRLNQFMFLRSRFTFNRSTNDVTPAFAFASNVSGLAGIQGNNQSPANWGPPSLAFTSIAGLSTGQFAANTNLANGGGSEIFWFRGRHSLTMGGNVRRQGYDIFSQQNPRGNFGFTGAATGSDLADFMLGLPQTSAIAFGNADKVFRQNVIEGLRQRRLPRVAGADAQPRPALGVRVADHRGAGAAGESQSRLGVHEQHARSWPGTAC
jgi:hypothetical protein